MELMKLATQEQLVHAAEIVSKYKDVPTTAPTATPLPRSMLASEAKTVEKKTDSAVPVVVRKDSTSLETAIGETRFVPES